MIRAVNRRYSDVDDGETERTRFEKFDNALFHGGDEIARNDTAADLVLKDKARAARQRLYLQYHIAELTMSASLSLVPPALCRAALDGFFVRYLRAMRFEL